MDRIKIPMVNSTLLALLFLALVAGTTGCKDNNKGSTGTDSELNLSETAQEAEDLQTFSQLITDAGLESLLGADGSYTIFAPTDSAFARFPSSVLDSLTSEQLTEVLNYHLISQELTQGDISGLSAVQTSQGDSIFINITNNIELNHKAMLTEGDIFASNGVLHKIDNVLLPDRYLTVFGIIEKRYTTRKFACNCTSGRTQLAPVLQRENQEFTVLVPTDEAFANYPVDVNTLSDDELRDLMNYHIVEQKLLSEDLNDGDSITTRNGASIAISVDAEGNISFNGGAATAVVVDLEGTNGVVYIIDTVLTPGG